MLLIRLLVLTCIMLTGYVPNPLHAETSFNLSDIKPNKGLHSRFLPVDQAFSVTGVRASNQLTVHFGVTPGHYLYVDRLKYIPDKTITLSLPKYNIEPSTEDDPDFGVVKVFDKDVQAAFKINGSGDVVVKWQGCAKAGLCYPPQETIIKATPVKLDEDMDASAPLSKSDQNIDTISSLNQTAHYLGVAPAIMDTERLMIDLTVPSSFDYPLMMGLKAYTNTALLTTADNTAEKPSKLTSECQVNHVVTDNDAFGLTTNPWLALGAIFIAGFLLSLTPCILPMVPIVVNMVAVQHQRSPLHGAALATAYVLGMATSYAVLGAIVAQFGQQINLIGWLQSPVVLMIFASVFVLLGLVTLGVIKLPIPYVLQHRLHQISQHGSRYLGASAAGSFLAGILAAFVVSPCVSAPLAALLLSVSITGNVALGALALGLFALGLGVPLIILGATEGRFLPKPGAWMDWIKKGFAFMLFGLALDLMQRVWTSPLLLLGWAILLLWVAYWWWVAPIQKGQWITKTLSVITLLLGITLGVGAALGNTDPRHPFSSPVSYKNAPVIYNLAQLNQITTKHPKVLVDVTADWCVACRKMERELFYKPPAELSEWYVIKLDITKNTPHANAALKQFQLFGPPALLYFVNGQLVAKVEGEVSRPAFESYLTLCK